MLCINHRENTENTNRDRDERIMFRNSSSDPELANNIAYAIVIDGKSSEATGKDPEYETIARLETEYEAV